MSDRFFSPTPITTERVTLDGPEAHHLLHVMRAAVGDAVTLFDDSGAEFAAIVETLRRADASLRIVERREIDRELPFALVVGVALPKGRPSEVARRKTDRARRHDARAADHRARRRPTHRERRSNA